MPASGTRTHAGFARRPFLAACCLALGLLAAGCRQDMHDQPRYKPYARSDFFSDRRASRALVPGTIARGHLRDDALLYEGKVDGQLSTVFPFPVTAEVMARGRERFDVFCSACHGFTGTGDGMIVRRGYRRPTSFHDERLRQVPPGYIYDVVTNGFGAMPDYATQIPVRDRWAIVAYLKALQRSQHATMADVPEAERGRLESVGQR
ncbi:MAG: cytochrome c [Acidobacteriota bacterium]